jgi:hypothetical protein
VYQKGAGSQHRIVESLAGAHVYEGEYIFEYRVVCGHFCSCTLQATSASNDNPFWHFDDKIGDLWTLAYVKEVIYNVGLDAMEPVSGHFFQLKTWPFAWYVSLAHTVSLLYPYSCLLSQALVQCMSNELRICQTRLMQRWICAQSQKLLLFALELAPSKNSPIFCSETFHLYLTAY